LYSLDDNEKFLLEGRLVIDESLPIQNKLRLLLDEVSRRHFSDLPPIEILETLKTKDGFVVVLNLTEDEQDFFQSKWYRRFQGSTGDSQTRFRLIYTSLQPDYPGFWFAGVKVFWNGKPIDSEDADLFISRITYRSKMRKNCSIGQECR